MYLLCIKNDVPIRGTTWVGGISWVIAIKKTIIESKALVAKLTRSPDSDGRRNDSKAFKIISGQCQHYKKLIFWIYNGSVLILWLILTLNLLEWF